MKKIVKIRFNFVQTSDGEVSGEGFEQIELGKCWMGLQVEKFHVDRDRDNIVISIYEHEESGGKTSYIVSFKKGDELKIYNPNLVFYAPDND